jgi:multidrug efflux pump subunit AcrB
MFMLSAVVVLLGAISLTKLPVDLMPEFSQPTITVNTNYPNVGPLEIEELITRRSSSRSARLQGSRASIRRRGKAAAMCASTLRGEQTSTRRQTM